MINESDPREGEPISSEVEPEDAPPRRRTSTGPTIFDVAQAAGVAPSTVSRAFSRPGRVNADTSARIRRIAQELGYRTAPMPRPAQGQPTKVIGLVISDVTNPFFFDIIRGVQDEVAKREYSVMLLDSRESDVHERQSIERVLDTVEGVVLGGSRLSDSSIRVIAKQKPTVVVNRVVSDIPSVSGDNARGVRRALELLGEKGHERITYLGGPEASWADGMRWRAMREGAHELGLSVRRIGPLEPTVSGSVEAAMAWEDKPTSAVVAYNDLLAIGFMRSLQARGHSIPEDVSVVGFDNIFVSELVTPALTTVAIPRRALGAAAVRMLELGIKSPVNKVPSAILPAKLIQRASVREVDASERRL